MYSSLIISKQKNILNNSLTKEEILIKSLIDEIYDAEQKISEINDTQKNNIENGIYYNNQKILELKEIQDILIKKINSLNDKFQEEFALKKEEILIQKNKLNDLDITLNEYQNKIEELNINEFKTPLIKYTIEKNINNKILSQEEINEINKKNKDNNETKNNKIKELKREIEIYKASESVILNNQKDLKLNLEKFNENFKMLKEEKLTTNDELLDIISYKETLECINKNNLINLNRSVKQNRNIIIKENISINMEEIKDINEPIKLFYFELMIIDLNKVPTILYNELSTSFIFISNDNKKNEINKSCNKKKPFYPKSQIKETHTIEIYDKKKLNKKESLNDINYKKKSLNNSCIYSSHDNNILEKNAFEIAIKEVINNFLEEKNELKINVLLDNISKIIIDQIKNEGEVQPDFNDNLIIYLTYFFKILYYDKVIKNKIKFVNKEYKTIKKEYNKAKEYANNEIIKLENKYEEINIKKIDVENKLNIITNIKNNNSDNIDLTEIEKEYIQICSKINLILKQKDDIKKNIIICENDINNKKIEKNNEIENINNEIETIKKEINDLNNTKELNTLKNNESIINYRKIIAEKFNIIRDQLQLYKQKYGTNISLYNKLISNINNSIQKTRNRIFINDSEDLCDNKFFNFNSSLITNSISNKKINKNNSFNKSINNTNTNTNKINELDLSKNWSKILNKTTSNIKASTPSDCNASLNELIFNYGNKNYNFINNIRIEKTNYSFNKYSTSSISNNTDKKRKKIIVKKKTNSRLKNDFETLNKNDFNINNFISKKDENSKTFSQSFFRKQNKIKRASSETETKLKKTKTNKGILNINLFKNKIPLSNYKGIPKVNSNNKLSKLIPLTKITFCYFREIYQQKNNNMKKYNPLIKITSKELCEFPFNFIKSTISLSKNYKKIKIVPSTQLEPIDFEITSIENTVVSTGIKSLIDIYRNYCKWKTNQKVNLNNFINEQINKYNDLTKEDIEKCISNKNFNFSLILKENKRRFEFIICSYDEFKMWINGMAFIIKNKDEMFDIINEN